MRDIRYNPLDWYWAADDGRVYSSAREVIVVPDDAAYTAWLAGGDTPTPWPLDEAGEQTAAALQSVLTPYGKFVDLTTYAWHVRRKCETAGVRWGEFIVPTAKEDCDRVTSVVAWQARTGKPVEFSFGAFSITLTPTMAGQLADVQGMHVQECFSAYSRAVSAINNGAITTFDQIDNIGWPLS